MGLKVAVFIILTWAVKRVNFDYAAPAISCIFPSAQEGQEATLTCMFQNIKKSSKQTVSVNAKLARTGIFHSVLTLQDPTSKPPTPNVSISQSADGNNWNVSIRYLKATKGDEGEYGCQLVSPGTPKSQSCQFTLGDSPDFVTASTQDEKGPRTTDETPKLSTEKALKKGNGGLDGGAIAGIVFAVLWIIAVAVFLVWYCKYWPKKLNKEDKDQVKAVYTHGGGNGSAEPTTSSEQETDQLMGESEQQLETMRKKQEEIEKDLRKQLAAKENDLKMTTETLQGKHCRELDGKNTQISELENKVQEYKQNLATVKNECIRLGTVLAERTKQVDDLKKEMTTETLQGKHCRELDGKNTQISELENKVQEYKQNLATVKNECIRLGTVLAERTKQVDDLKKEHEAAVAAERQSNKELVTTLIDRQPRENISKLEQQLEKAREDQLRLRQKIGELKEQNKMLEKELIEQREKALKERIEGLQMELNSERQQGVRKVEGTPKTDERHLEYLEKEISDLKEQVRALEERCTEDTTDGDLSTMRVQDRPENPDGGAAMMEGDAQPSTSQNQTWYDRPPVQVGNTEAAQVETSSGSTNCSLPHPQQTSTSKSASPATATCSPKTPTTVSDSAGTPD